MDKGITALALSVMILSSSAIVCAQEIDLSILLEHHQTPMFLQSSGQTYLLGVAGEQRDEKPPLSTGRIAGEFLAGEVGGFVGILPGLMLGSMVAGYAPGGDRDGSAARLVLGVATAGAVVALGSATGVYIVGNIGNETGSFLPTFYGAAAGLGVGFGGGLIIYAISDDNYTGMGFIGMAIGATIGFNLTRRYDSPLAGSKTAPSNVRDGLSVDLLRIGF
jgi:hypothetical protein